MRVLVVDDEEPLRRYLVPLLEGNGYTTTEAATGADALWQVEESPPDAMLLDLELPDMDGLDVIATVRRRPKYLPVLMLTCRSNPADELAGLHAKADDYITKPFRSETLLARLRAVLRLARLATDRRVRLNNVDVDLATREVRRDGRLLPTTRREFDLLAYLLEHPNQVLGRRTLLTAVWGFDFDGTEDTVTRHISRLRAVVEDNPNRPELLCTRPGVGYFLRWSPSP
jgi:DNA-binding response OmpR family regulator